MHVLKFAGMYCSCVQLQAYKDVCNLCLNTTSKHMSREITSLLLIEASEVYMLKHHVCLITPLCKHTSVHSVSAQIVGKFDSFKPFGVPQDDLAFNSELSQLSHISFPPNPLMTSKQQHTHNDCRKRNTYTSAHIYACTLRLTQLRTRTSA